MDECQQSIKRAYNFSQHFFTTRVFALTCVCLHIIITSGLAYGWNALLLILKGEKKYRFLCSESFDEFQYCEAEQLYLSNLFTIAYTLQYLGGFPLGLIVDYLGTRCPIIGHFISMSCFLGLAFFKPSSQMMFDWNYVFLSLIFLSRYFISTRYYHYANLFTSNFNLASTLISTSTIISGGIFPLMYFIWEYANLSFQNILTTFVVIQSPFILFCLIQPKIPFKFGERITFSTRLLKFKVITYSEAKQIPNLSITRLDSLPYKKHFPSDLQISIFPSYQNQDTDVKHFNSENIHTNNYSLSSSDSDFQNKNISDITKSSTLIHFSQDFLETPSNSTNHLFFSLETFRNLQKALLLRFKILFVTLLLPNILFSLWFLFFSTYLQSANFILYEISGDENKVELYTLIFSCIIPFGFVGSLFFAAMGDLTSTKTMIIGYISIGLLHLLFIFLPFGYIYLSTFITYTIGEDLLFASQISILSQSSSESIFCSVLGLFYSYCGFFVFLAGRLTLLLIQGVLKWQILFIIYTVVGFCTLIISFKLKSYRPTVTKF